MKIAIGGDHAGFHYKERLKDYLSSHGFVVQDFGPDSAESADYPDFVHPACESIEKGENDYGILICGSGNGVAMTANKHQKIRAAYCYNRDLAELARQHNNANMLCMGARFIAYELAESIANTFLNSPFEGGRHERRVNKISC